MGICAGGLADGPEIEVNADKLAEAIAVEIEKIPQRVRENCESFPREILDADPDEFAVPDTELKLNKDTPEQEIAMAAIESAYGPEARSAVVEAVWSHFEKQINQQLNRRHDVSERQKQSAKKKAKTETVEVAVNEAMDEALSNMKAD